MSKKRRSSGASRQKNPKSWFAKSLLLTVIWFAIAVTLFVGWCAIDLPDIHQITQPQRRPSIVLESDDGTVFARFGDLYGDRVTLADVPKYLPQAIIAI